MSVHLLLVFVPCFLIAAGDTKIEVKNWKRTFAGFFAMTAWAMFGNLAVDPAANNMFLMTNPFLEGPIPLLNAIPNGVHVLVLVGFFSLGFFITYRFLAWFEKIIKRTRETKVVRDETVE
jgi:hypothetical protein